jgi:two-component system CheB/CheR fusion protein
MARILVVDDDEDVLETLEATLDEAGHSVRPAASASAALSAGPQQFDVLLVDLWMRPASGLDLKRELDQRQITVPAILMSSDDNVGTHAMRGAFFEYLRKPFSPDQLHAAVNRALADSPAVSSDRQAALVPSLPGEQAMTGDDDGKGDGNGDEPS